MNNKKHSKETREKISFSNKGKHSRKFTEEHKNKISQALKGKSKSEDHKNKMSEAGKRKIFTDLHKMHLKESLKGDKNGFYGKTHSDEVKKIISKIHKGKKLSEDHIKAIRNYTTGRKLTERHIKILRERMINGGSIKASSFITNPSKPQVKLYNLVSSLFSDSVLNFPVEKVNSCIDIAILEHKIAIEYDGSYWHQDEEKDKERQTELEKLGWKFIRYRDYIPSIEKLKSDLEILILGDLI